MIDTIIGYAKWIIGLCIGAWLIWMGITNADTVANIIVTIVNAVKVFFTTLANGIF
ncbi:hypothetical protein ABZ215_25015 [Amycolatopsis sp. NPDC006131]|uniref:hypothetical protein n=1 Tax=Amycolatopsis sp. NPDC006131 TaxID=3156731 RepID=UPI0033A4224A